MNSRRSPPSIVRIEKEGAYADLCTQFSAREAVQRLCGEETLTLVPKKFLGTSEVHVYRVRHRLTPYRDQLRVSNEHPRAIGDFGYEIVDYSWESDFEAVFWGFLFDNSYKTKIRTARELASEMPSMSKYTDEQLLWVLDTCRFHWGIAITGWPLLRGEHLESVPFNREEIAPFNSLISELIGGANLLYTEKILSRFFSRNGAAVEVQQGWIDLLDTTTVKSLAELGYYAINTQELQKLVTACIQSMRSSLKYKF